MNPIFRKVYAPPRFSGVLPFMISSHSLRHFDRLSAPLRGENTFLQ